MKIKFMIFGIVLMMFVMSGCIFFGQSSDCNPECSEGYVCDNGLCVLDEEEVVESVYEFTSVLLDDGEALADVLSSIGSQELPTLLADGEFVTTLDTYPYQQRLDFLSSLTNIFTYGQGFYIDSQEYSVTYVLEFTSPVIYTTDVYNEFFGSDLVIQDNNFVVTDAVLTSDVLTELELVGGESDLLTEGESVTRTVDGVDRTVGFTVTDGTMCTLDVDGTSVDIDVGDVQEVNYLMVGVLQAIDDPSTSDLCEIVIGAIQYSLVDGSEVMVDGAAVPGTLAEFDAAVGTWNSLSLSFASESGTTLAGGDEYVFPLLGMIKFSIVENGQQVEVYIAEAGTPQSEFS